MIGPPMRRALPALGALALALCGAAGAAEITWMSGAARAVDRGLSASRDTPVIEVAFGPRAQTSVGFEFGLASASTGSVTWRQGWFGLIAMENHATDWLFPANELWRGLLGLNLSVAFDEWALRRLGAGGALELSLAAGHESDHATDDRNPFPPGDGDVPDGGAGNHVAVELAARLQPGAWRLTTRLETRFYLEGNFAWGPRAGVQLDYLGLARGKARPYLSVHAEDLVSDQAWPDARRMRAVAGLAFPGAHGTLAVFGAVSAGSGYGLLINRREGQLSAGLRLSLD